MTRGQRNIAWIEEHCRIPEGRFVGQPVKLRPWQREIIRGIYDQPTRRAIISFGRKNAKSTLSAWLLLLHLCGPEARANSQLFSAAQSREQASVLFALAAKTVRLSGLHEYVAIRDSTKQLFCPELGTLYRALSAEASTAYGLSPVFIVHDELGQVKGPRSELYEALETATAAQDAPLSIVISTQAPTDADLLSVLIDDAKAENDPRVRLFLWTSSEEDDPVDVATIKAANPAFGDFQNEQEVLAMAEDARRMPAREAEYRNLVLNQRVETASPFVSKGLWLSCGDPVTDSFAGLKVYAGLDLSETNDLTALVLIAAHEGKWHVKPTFWLPEEGLKERARKDRVAATGCACLACRRRPHPDDQHAETGPDGAARRYLSTGPRLGGCQCLQRRAPCRHRRDRAASVAAGSVSSGALAQPFSRSLVCMARSCTTVARTKMKDVQW
jgi:phage terminase large subunit-like protein